MENAVSGQSVFPLSASRLSVRGLVPLMKAALKIFGVDIGDPPDPYRPLNTREVEDLKKFIKGHELLDMLF